MTSNYKIEFEKFFSYSLSLDCLIFGYKEGQIHLLLIKRNLDPYKGDWAIPGDLVYPDEDLPEAASRILFDLTQLDNLKLHQAQTFGNPSRHPQGRVITCAYFALVKIDEVNAIASSWANELMWTPVHEIGNLAFDHKEIVDSTFETLKNKLKTEPICFDLLPEKFTLHELQQIYEYAFKTDLNKEQEEFIKNFYGKKSESKWYEANTDANMENDAEHSALNALLKNTNGKYDYVDSSYIFIELEKS
jgi:8-oxo-dGTP diphosphatase